MASRPPTSSSTSTSTSPAATHVPPGWDEWHGKLDEQKLYDYRINENGEVVSYGSEPEDFFTDVLSGQATDFVRRTASDSSRPFFAYVTQRRRTRTRPRLAPRGGLRRGGGPRTPSFNEENVSDKPPIGDARRVSDEQASEIDDYYRQRLESMLAVDEMVTSLVEELEAAGVLDDTFIFFTSDNGWGEHRIKRGKNRPYEEAARVPLFVRGPGVPAGSNVERLALNTDFAPTFAELAGVSFPADGRSLAPLLRAENPRWRSSVLLERLPAEEGDVEGSGKAKGKGKGKNKDKTKAGGVPKGGAGGTPPFEAVRTETHKYVEYENGETELYDLEADPYEMDNIYDSADPSLVEDLKARLDALRTCSEDGCREAEDAP